MSETFARSEPHMLRFGRFWIGHGAAVTGRWERDGKLTPWLWINRPRKERLGGIQVFVGRHVVGVYWLRDTATKGEP